MEPTTLVGWEESVTQGMVCQSPKVKGGPRGEDAINCSQYCL